MKIGNISNAEYTLDTRFPPLSSSSSRPVCLASRRPACRRAARRPRRRTPRGSGRGSRRRRGGCPRPRRRRAPCAAGRFPRSSHSLNVPSYEQDANLCSFPGHQRDAHDHLLRCVVRSRVRESVSANATEKKTRTTGDASRGTKRNRARARRARGRLGKKLEICSPHSARGTRASGTEASRHRRRASRGARSVWRPRGGNARIKKKRKNRARSGRSVTETAKRTWCASSNVVIPPWFAPPSGPRRARPVPPPAPRTRAPSARTATARHRLRRVEALRAGA